MTLELAVSPRGPYSLRVSARSAGDATRCWKGDRLVMRLTVGDGIEGASAHQRLDGQVTLRAESEQGLERVRFVLGLDDDHTPFLQRFAHDPLLAGAIRYLRGLRPIRVPTVAQALLRAVCGQLIQAKRARAIERRIVRAAGDEAGGLHPPPTAAQLGRYAPAELHVLGLSARKAATLVRLCRAVDLERLAGLETAAVAARLERERGLGPWSVGVVCLEGLGRYDRGLVGDLGLIKLCSALHGRWADAADTEELLAPYGEWRGLASVYLLAGFARGVLPLPAGSRRRARTRIAA